MKTILLLISGFLISQTTLGKEIKGNALADDLKARGIESAYTAFRNPAHSDKAFATEKNRIWLNLTNAGGAFKQILVGYVYGATNGLDKLFDGVSIDSNPYVDFYSINLGKNLTIQGRGLPFVTTDEVPLGYRTSVAGEFQISIDHVDGLFLSTPQDIFLKDLTTGAIHNLKNGAYSFTTAEGRFNDRFVLLYIDNTPVTPSVPDELVTEVTDQEILLPESPAPDAIEPVNTDPVVSVPEAPVTVVTDPVITDPIVAVPETPEPAVTEPMTKDPIVSVPEIPAPVVTEPVVDTPVVIIPEIPDSVVTAPEVTDVPEIPVPVVKEPEVIEPVVTVPEIPAPISTEPEVTVPVTSEPIPALVITDEKMYGGKGNTVYVAVNNSEVTVYSKEDSILGVYIYSTGHKQLFEKNNINTNEFVISGLNAATQILIIKTQLKNGKWSTNKVVL
ncbi:hypothetical protein [Flavobacterium aestuarii]|uniref:hypothetical protein n=1 Tax=Flavobacterium aestuarii TaxID=3149227 RepID=UPI0032B45E20